MYSVGLALPQHPISGPGSGTQAMRSAGGTNAEGAWRVRLLSAATQRHCTAEKGAAALRHRVGPDGTLDIRCYGGGGGALRQN